MHSPKLAQHANVFLCVAVATFLFAACSPKDDAAPAAGVTEAPAPAVPRASQPEDVKPARPVVAEALPYAEVDEKLVYGYFAIPEDMIDPLPAIIVIHDWWGLDDNMRGTVERLAGEGYIVLGIDLFGGNTAASLGDARVLEIAVVENPNLALENLKQAHDFIANTAGAPDVAVLGLGFGGGWSLRAATELGVAFGACVTYYGQVPGDNSVLGRLTAPFLGLFADNDRAVPKTEVLAFEEGMQALEKDAEVVFFDARRGFADRRSENYSPADAEDAWNRVVDFLSEKMAPDA